MPFQLQRDMAHRAIVRRAACLMQDVVQEAWGMGGGAMRFQICTSWH